MSSPAAVQITKGEVDKTALRKIGYGLYVVTCNDGKKDNGCIVNSVLQAADNPLRVVVCINKANYTYEVVHSTGILNVHALTVEEPLEVFQHFGFQSGRDVDKFAECGENVTRSTNGLIILPDHSNAFMSLHVLSETDLGSHGMFICEVTESAKLSDLETMSYSYYQSNVKPKPQPKPTEKTTWVCSVCGYVYEGDELPEDFICPVCNHPASDFEKQ